MTCYAYLADVTEEPHLLTLRAGIYSAIQTAASGLGGFLAAAFASVVIIASSSSSFCIIKVVL